MNDILNRHGLAIDVESRGHDGGHLPSTLFIRNTHRIPEWLRFLVE